MKTLFNKKQPAEIMIVDDLPANLMLLSEILEQADYSVRQADDSQLAYQSICAKLPDLILLDVMMPVLTGYELCRLLKSNSTTKEIPVIFISALSGENDIITGFSVGGTDYITKPFKREEVLYRVKNHLELSFSRQKLNEQLYFQQNLLNSISNPIYFKDLKGYYIGCNKAFEKSFGLTSEQIHGKTILDLANESNDPNAMTYCKIFHDKEIDLLNSDLVTMSLDAPAKFADSTVHQIVTDKTVFFNRDGEKQGIISIVRDVTQERIMTEKLKKSQEHYKAIFENFPALVWMSNEDALCYYFNKTWLSFTGRLMEEELGNGWAKGVYPDDFDRCLKIYLDNFAKREPFDMEYRLKHHSGEYRWISDHGQPFYDIDGCFIGYIGSCYDISEKKKNESQLRHSQKMEAIGVLAAGIAHEINSPMQYILDNTRFLEDSVKDFLKLIDALKEHNFQSDPENCAKIKDMLNNFDIDFLSEEIPQAINENIDGIAKIRNIISALKDFSFPRGFVLTDTNINKTLETIILITSSTWKHCASIKNELADDLPLLPCYADELNQVFINLIVNATDAITDKNTTDGIIKIATLKVDDCIHISISDNGSGIPDNVKSRIFEPFFTTKEVGKGTGQGLAIVYDIIHNLHKGSIEVISEVGKGTEFVIKLPLTAVEN